MISLKFYGDRYKTENEGLLTKADETGKQRRYIAGVTTGEVEDLEGERMTKACVDDMVKQAEESQILLYPDEHGIKRSNDIGILTKSQRLENGDWYTEYRLYDKYDNIGNNKLEKIDTIWRQMKGEQPYKKPMQNGFSIEGAIPEDGIIEAQKDENGNLTNRVINKVILDGVCLVPRQAYPHSIASAVYKSLGELPPKKKTELRKGFDAVFSNVSRKEESSERYYETRWQLQDALDQTVENIMRINRPSKAEELEMAFNSYKQHMVTLILENEILFEKSIIDKPAEPQNGMANNNEEIRKQKKISILNQISKEVDKLNKVRKTNG